MRLVEGESVQEIPKYLVYAAQHNRWGSLPEGGGLRDQPAGWLDKMAKLYAVYSGLQAYKNSTNTVKWAEQNPGLWDTVAEARGLYREWQTKSSKS